MPVSIRYGKNVKKSKCLSKLGMENRKNCKMPISFRYGKNAKCLSQLGMEKRKHHKMPISIRYGKNVKIAKCLYQLGKEETGFSFFVISMDYTA